jgi:hypothetical protein
VVGHSSIEGTIVALEGDEVQSFVQAATTTGDMIETQQDALLECVTGVVRRLVQA